MRSGVALAAIAWARRFSPPQHRLAPDDPSGASGAACVARLGATDRIKAEGGSEKAAPGR